jgi:hypothetical protein
MPSLGYYSAQDQLDDLVYGASDVPRPAPAPVATENSAPAPAPTQPVYTENSAPPPSSTQIGAGEGGAPIGAGQYPTTEQGLGYAPSTEQMAAPAMDPYGGYTAPAPAPADPVFTGGGASTYYGGADSAGSLPFGTGQTTSTYPAANYGGYDAAQPLPAQGENNWAPGWDDVVNTARRAGEGAGLFPQTAYAQQEGLTDEVGGGGGGRGGAGVPGRGGVGRPLDSEPGGVRARRQGMVPSNVQVGDSLTFNPAATTRSLPSNTPIGTGRRVINTSGTANPQAPRNQGQIQRGAQALGDPYARMPTGTTPATRSVPGYTVASGNPTPARGVTATTPAGPSTLPTGTTPFPPLPFSPTMGVPGVNALTPKQIGAGLAGLAGLGAGAMFGPAFVEDVARRDVTQAEGESTFVPGADYGPRAPWRPQGQRVGSTSARDQDDVLASTRESTGVRDAAWTSGSRDWLEDRGVRPSQTAGAEDPIFTPDGSSAQPNATRPAPPIDPGAIPYVVTPDGDLTPVNDLGSAISGIGVEAIPGAEDLKGALPIHTVWTGADGTTAISPAAFLPKVSHDAAVARGDLPASLDLEEFTALQAAGLIGADIAPEELVGVSILAPKAWKPYIKTGEPVVYTPVPEDAVTVPTSNTSGDSGSGWVDYDNDYSGGYRRSNYSRGGGGGYSRSYGGGGGYSRGGGGYGGGYSGGGGGGGGFPGTMPDLASFFGPGAFDNPIFDGLFNRGGDSGGGGLRGSRGMRLKRGRRRRGGKMPTGMKATFQMPVPGEPLVGRNAAESMNLERLAKMRDRA